MAENEKQPDRKKRKDIAYLAGVHKLNQFEDLSLVGNHAERFSMNPAKVFWKCSFEDVVAFAVENKERQEFRERYNDIYQKLNESTGGNTGSEYNGNRS
jgi:hypothetical protein